MSRASVLSIVNFTLYILCCLASFISLTAFFPIIMLIFLFNMLLLVLFFSCLSSALVSSSPTIFSCYCPLFPRTLMLFIQPATIFCFQPAVPFSAPLLCLLYSAALYCAPLCAIRFAFTLFYAIAALLSVFRCLLCCLPCLPYLVCAPLFSRACQYLFSIRHHIFHCFCSPPSAILK